VHHLYRLHYLHYFLHMPSQIQQHFQQKQQNEQLQKQRQQLSQLTGFDLSGFSPDMLQEVAKQHFQQQGKQAIQNQKQDFLSKIFGGNQQIGQSPDQMLQGQPQMNQQQMGGFDPSQISDADIARATSMDPALGRELRAAKDTGLRERREEQKLNFEREKLGRKEESEISKPVLLELNESRKNIPLQEQAILDIQEAAPNVSALDYFADVTGFEPARSAEGAKLKTAIKDFFLSDLSRAGTRPNMWIEQQLADALPKIP